MNIIALDAGNESCSVALICNEKITSLHELAPRKQTQLLLPMVDTLLTQNHIALTDLDALVFNRGPGSFTGVRLTASVVQGLSYASGVGVLPVSALDALAYQQYLVSNDEYIFCALDARKNEIYYAFYQCMDSKISRMSNEQVGSVHNVIEPEPRNWVATGNGATQYKNELLAHSMRVDIHDSVIAYADAKHFALLALQLNSYEDVLLSGQAQPVYIRNQVTG